MVKYTVVACLAAATKNARDSKMIEKWPITIPALSGRKKRNAYVYLPEEARENEDARFPVLYMFDGHNVFFDEDATYGKSWGMGRYMDETQTPMIIAPKLWSVLKNIA